MRLPDDIKRLFGVRSPSLEANGYYTCSNCSRTDLRWAGVGPALYCPIKKEFVYSGGTCKRAKPKGARFGVEALRGQRAKANIVEDHVCDIPDEVLTDVLRPFVKGETK